ncbi:Hypothetical predicted protein [Scomber scombrus]|uniref:Uncharacterized protein n=1 Tax=Scomber scombrus TaxID=13677 RepID=A0AAV1NYY7_SCOSC
MEPKRVTKYWKAEYDQLSEMEEAAAELKTMKENLETLWEEMEKSVIQISIEKDKEQWSHKEIQMEQEMTCPILKNVVLQVHHVT